MQTDHPDAAEGTMVGDDANRPCSTDAVVASGEIAREASDEVAAVMEAVVAAASACVSDQAAGAAAGRDPPAAKSLSGQAIGAPAPEEEPALQNADCAPMDVDSGDDGTACAAMQPEEATLEHPAADIPVDAHALAVPVHGKVASIVANEDDEDSPSLQLNLQLETQYPEQQAIAAQDPVLVPDSEAPNTGATGPTPLSNAGNDVRRDPPASQCGLLCPPAPVSCPSSAPQREPSSASGPARSGSAQQGEAPASAGTLGGAANGGDTAAGPSHPLVPDSEAAGHIAAAAPSEPAPVSAPGTSQPALEGRAAATRSQDDAWGAILSTSPQPSCGMAPTQKAPAWQPRSGPGPGLAAGEHQRLSCVCLKLSA